MRSRFSCGFLLVLSYYVFLPISDVLLRRFFLIRGAPQTLFLLAELSFSTVSQKISATSSSYSSTFCCCFFHQLLWWLLLLLLLIGAARGKRKFFTQALVVHGFFSSPLAGRRTCCRIPHPQFSPSSGATSGTLKFDERSPSLCVVVCSENSGAGKKFTLPAPPS